jgi:ABC-type glutathione transport system ATPase component
MSRFEQQSGILEARGVSYSLPRNASPKKRPQSILHEITFSLAEGEWIMVMGPSGSGKTTLARLLVGLVRPMSGSVLYKGQKIWCSSTDTVGRPDGGWIQRFRQEVRYVPQGSKGTLNPGMKVAEIIAEPIERHTSNSASRNRERVAEVIDQVGLTKELLEAYPERLSGGECRRVSLARALVHPPRVLIADEPTSGLDFRAARGLRDLLQRLRETYSLSIVIISHDPSDLLGQLNRVLVLAGGKIRGILSSRDANVDDICRLMESRGNRSVGGVKHDHEL